MLRRAQLGKPGWDGGAQARPRARAAPVKPLPSWELSFPEIYRNKACQRQQGVVVPSFGFGFAVRCLGP